MVPSLACSVVDDPMTANEAGAGEFKRAFGHMNVPVDSTFSGKPRTSPSKPCTEGGEHCFCVEIEDMLNQVAVSLVICCWCEKPKACKRQRVPGHGPHRTELVRE